MKLGTIVYSDDSEKVWNACMRGQEYQAVGIIGKDNAARTPTFRARRGWNWSCAISLRCGFYVGKKAVKKAILAHRLADAKL
jgi:hypothetical protein